MPLIRAWVQVDGHDDLPPGPRALPGPQKETCPLSRGMIGSSYIEASPPFNGQLRFFGPAARDTTFYKIRP